MTPPTSNPSSAMSQELSEKVAHRLRVFVQAYPETIFAPLTDEETARLGPNLVSRCSAGMGRHFAKFAGEAATHIDTQAEALLSLQRKNEELVRALTAILGCEYDGKGLTDCIDNDGGHYQSAHLERCIREAEQALRSISEEK